MKERWKPKLNNRYWFLWMDGDICATEWLDDSTDKKRDIFNNVFRTRKEALQAAKKIKKILKGKGEEDKMKKETKSREANKDVYKENYELRKQVDAMKSGFSEIGSILVCIGGALNDNILNYSKKQLKPLSNIYRIVKYYE